MRPWHGGIYLVQHLSFGRTQMLKALQQLCGKLQVTGMMSLPVWEAGTCSAAHLLAFFSFPSLVKFSDLTSSHCRPGLGPCICRWKCGVLRFPLELMSCHFAVTLSAAAKPASLSALPVKKAGFGLIQELRLKKKSWLCAQYYLVLCPRLLSFLPSSGIDWLQEGWRG